MSKLGFDKVIRRLDTVERNFLRRGMAAAQKEFKNNFNKEQDSETGKSWDMVLRGYPPPILDVTGQLRAEALSKGNIRYYRNTAVLTVDPIEAGRNRGYAQYHQDGIGNNPHRPFITQSKELTNEQERILFEELNKAFM